MIIVSACLLGLCTRYDGYHSVNELLLKYCKYNKFLPVCPEQLGGLPTPRRPVELVIVDNIIVAAQTKDGIDVKQNIAHGTQQILQILDWFAINAAIMKERSPSCGVHYVYDGTFSNTVIPGQGITTTALRSRGVDVYADQEVTSALLERLLQL